MRHFKALLMMITMSYVSCSLNAYADIPPPVSLLRPSIISTSITHKTEDSFKAPLHSIDANDGPDRVAVDRALQAYKALMLRPIKKACDEPHRT